MSPDQYYYRNLLILQVKQKKSGSSYDIVEDGKMPKKKICFGMAKVLKITLLDALLSIKRT